MSNIVSAITTKKITGVLEHQGKVTLVKHFAQGWILPTGVTMQGESEIACLKRLAFSQTGIQLYSVEPIHFFDLSTNYFYAHATDLSIVPPHPEIQEIAVVTVEEANYLFRESSLEFGSHSNHQSVLHFCLQKNILSSKPVQLSSRFIVPSHEQQDRYRLNISRSFSSLYSLVKNLDTGVGKKPYFEYDHKRIYLSVSDR